MIIDHWIGHQRNAQPFDKVANDGFVATGDILA